ncbi:MAG: vitamin K epoxide reductase family protein [Anaerolineae bacterium]
MSKCLRLIGFLMLLWIMPVSVHAQSSHDPVVYGLFFYSPSCTHCHTVINDHWGTIQEEFGEQLRVLFINVQMPDGSAIMEATRAAMSIESRGVPMLVIGDEVLVGSLDIPQRAPLVIRQGIADGGIAVPPVPDIEALFIEALGDAYVVNDVSQLASAPTFSDDPANWLALAMLGALSLSLVLVGGATINPRLRGLISERVGLGVLVLTALVGVGLTLSLLLGSTDWLISGIILLMLLALLASLYVLTSSHSWLTVARQIMPLLIVVGLLVAAYMTYVETTASEAICGTLGDCNTVQQSPYAQIFGVPIGAIGLVAYMILLALWLIGEREQRAYMLLFVLVAFGVLFSIYLTFLEPFVIGASCMWCLTSALTMIGLLWAVAPLAWAVWKQPALTT